MSINIFGKEKKTDGKMLNLQIDAIFKLEI